MISRKSFAAGPGGDDHRETREMRHAAEYYTPQTGLQYARSTAISEAIRAPARAAILASKMYRTPHGRLKLARVAAGYPTAKSFADALRVPQPTYALHEAGKRGLSRDVAVRYAQALGNCDPEWLLTGSGRRPTLNGGKIAGRNIDDELAPNPLTLFTVLGSVEAGAWRESAEIAGELEQVHFEARPEFRGARRFGMRVAGPAMDAIYPPGTILDCVAYEGLARTPQDGDHVIVHRFGPDNLVEVTVKEVVRSGRGWLLQPRSTHPAYQEPISVETLPADDVARVKIIAFVIGYYARRV